MVTKPAVGTPLRIRRPLIRLLARLTPMPKDVRVERASRGGVPGELIVPAGADGPPRLVYLHGGAYVAGGPSVHRALAARLAEGAGVSAFSADYRLAPEHPCPAAIEDAIAAYAAVCDGAPGAGVVMAGDSAGGGLALATAIQAPDRGLVLPAGLGLISPWIDMTMSGPSCSENDGPDALLAAGPMRRAAVEYRAGRSATDPLCSPLFADLDGLPPILIHAGSRELLLSDSQELHERAVAAGVLAELKVFDGLWHEFHVHAGMLAEADEAVAEMGDWLAARLGPA